jgi:5-methylthioadenosine/S-adenosylhomocysteine deaminase
VLLKDIDTAFRQDDDRTVAHGVDVLVRDGRIVEVGEGLSGGDVVDCSDRVALPGLINCHTHTPNLLTRGYSDDRRLFPWLDANEAVIAAADREHKRAAARISAVRMLETGTTACNDMWNTYLADDLAATGIRAFLGHAMAAFDDTDPGVVEEGLDHAERFVEGYRDHRTVHPTVPVHSTYRATERLVRDAHGIAARHDVPFHVHVSETREGNERCLDRRGLTPTAWLDDCGALDRRGVLAHCVHLTDDDRERIRESDAGVAHCPSANLKLGSGVADVPAMDGVPVGLGTDSAASNNDLNLFREARTAALVHKRADPAAITAGRVLDMATREAAAVLGVADELGSIEAGKRADLVLLDAGDPTLCPHHGDAGLLSNLVYSFHGHAETVIVDGEVVVDDGSALAGIDDAVEIVQAFCDGVGGRPGRPG